MDRDVAIRIDGMLIGVSGSLNGIANYMKNNVSEQEIPRVGSFDRKIDGCFDGYFRPFVFKLSGHRAKGIDAAHAHQRTRQ